MLSEPFTLKSALLSLPHNQALYCLSYAKTHGLRSNHVFESHQDGHFVAMIAFSVSLGIPYTITEEHWTGFAEMLDTPPPEPLDERLSAAENILGQCISELTSRYAHVALVPAIIEHFAKHGIDILADIIEDED